MKLIKTAEKRVSIFIWIVYHTGSITLLELRVFLVRGTRSRNRLSNDVGLLRGRLSPRVVYATTQLCGCLILGICISTTGVNVTNRCNRGAGAMQAALRNASW